jgi:hypothetical protein
MAKAEFPLDAERSPIISGLQVIFGVLILLVVATVSYGVLLTISGLISGFFRIFPFGTGNLIRVIITASIGMWLGAASLKLVFPRVSRRAVFRIIASLMLVAIVGGSLVMAVKGTLEGWQGVISAVAFLVTSATYVRGEDWKDLPGRKVS